MAMMVPMRRNRNLLSELMTDPVDAFFNAASAPMQKMSPTLMRTDIKETDAGFELTIDLPGFKKDDVQAELKDGYLTITAQTQSESEDKDEEGTYVRKERFSGKCSRTFYVGDDIEEDDIKAKFEDGVLKIAVPKKQEQPKLEEKKTSPSRVNPSRNASALEGGHRDRLPCFHPKARFVACARDDRRSRAKQADQNACFT